MKSTLKNKCLLPRTNLLLILAYFCLYLFASVNTVKPVNAQASSSPSSSSPTLTPTPHKDIFWERVYNVSLVSFGVSFLSFVGGGIWYISNIEYSCRGRDPIHKYNEARCQSQPSDFIQYHSESARKGSVSLSLGGLTLGAISLGMALYSAKKLGIPIKERPGNLAQPRSDRNNSIPELSLSFDSSTFQISGGWSF